VARSSMICLIVTAERLHRLRRMKKENRQGDRDRLGGLLHKNDGCVSVAMR